MLALETLKRALDPGNRARDVLVGQALQAGLLPLLLRKLDWSTSGQQGAKVMLRTAIFSASTFSRLLLV